MNTEAQHQDANIQPARRGQGVAVLVDATARSYDLTRLAWNANPWNRGSQEFVYLDLQNNGAADIYYYVTNDSGLPDLNEATIQNAGDALALVNAVPKVLRAGQDAPVRLQRDLDKFLVLKSAGSTLRIFPSSNSSARSQ
jgi:hypothetical protein